MVVQPFPWFRNATERLVATLIIGVLLASLFLPYPVHGQSALGSKPFTPHEIKVLVVSPNQLYHSGAGLLVADLARYGFNITYEASSISANPDYLSSDKTSQLGQYDVVILHGILGYPPSKVSVEELNHFTDFNGVLIVIGTALFTNETSGQFWENTFTSSPIMKLEQRLGIDFTGDLTTPYHNNGTFHLVDRTIAGLPESLQYTTMYNQSINRQLAITLGSSATEVYNFTTQSGSSTAGVTFYRNSTTGAVGIYIQGSYIYAEEVPISSRRIRYFGLADTQTRSRLLGPLIAHSFEADIETIIKPQPLATVRLDAVGERAFTDAYLSSSLANFNSVVDNYGITPSVAFTDFAALYPQYWRTTAPYSLSQLKSAYRDWEYSPSLRNTNLTLMTQVEIEALLQNMRGNYTELGMDLFSTGAVAAGSWSQATLDAMANRHLYLLDSAWNNVMLVNDFSDWWKVNVSSGVVGHNSVRMADKSVENFTQFGYSQDYLHYLYFSMRDRLMLSTVDGFPSFVYGVSNFRWNQVGTYSMETVYRNLTSENPDIRFVPLVEAALYFGNPWIGIENAVRSGSIVDFDLNVSAVPDVASIGKGMVWLTINSVDKIGEVTIDGQPWSYFDDRSIRLPASNVHVRVLLGQRLTPLVISSAYKVVFTSWNNQSFVVTVDAAEGLNVTVKMLLPAIGPFAGLWTAYSSESQGNWDYAFDESSRVLSFWAISDGSLTFSAGADVVPPLIGQVTYSMTVYFASVKVKADVTDPGSGVRNASLSYLPSGSEWTNVTMIFDGEHYVGEIPPTAYGTTVSFKVYGEDNAGNWQVSRIYTYRVMDWTPPSVSTPVWNPSTPSADQSVLVQVAVTEPGGASGVRVVRLHFSVDNRTFVSVAMSYENGTWQALIPPRNSSGQMTFYVQAFDKAGNSMRTRSYSYNVQGVATPPYLPIAVAAAVLAGVIGVAFYFVKIRRPKASKRIMKVS